MANTFFDGDPIGRLVATSNSTIGTVGTTTGISVTHKQIGTKIRSTFTLASVPQTVVNGVEYQGTKLFDFPKGQLRIEGATLSIAQTTTSAIATTLNSGAVGAVGIGSATAISTTLATTTQNIIPTTAFVTSTVINVAGAAVSGLLGTGVYTDAFLLGSTTTVTSLYLNTAYATTTDCDGDATQTLTGTLVVTWDFLGGLESLI
jgi:hypothetical protein